MNNAVDYFAATIPEPWQILGLRLRPFSLGHYKLLRRFDCAFVSDEKTKASVDDLILGVLACSRSPQEFLSMLNLPNFKQDANDWGKALGVFVLEEKVKMFADYIREHSKIPPYWEEGDSKPSGAHWSQCVEVSLRSKLGWTSEEIDTLPLSKAFADYFKHAENEGMIRLMTPEEFSSVGGVK